MEVMERCGLALVQCSVCIRAWTDLSRKSPPLIVTFCLIWCQYGVKTVNCGCEISTTVSDVSF